MAEHDSDRENRESREPAEPVGPVEPVERAEQVEQAEQAESAGAVGRTDPPGAGAPADRAGGADPAGAVAAGDGPAGEGAGVPFDEEAAWAAIVAGYGEEPPDPPGARPYRPVRDLPLPDTDLPGDPPGEPRQGTDRTDSERPDGQRHDGERPDGQRHDGERPDRPGPGGDRPAPARPLGGSVSFAPGVGPRDYSPPERSGDDYADDEGHFVPPEPPPLPDADVTAKFAWLAVIGGPVLLLLAVLLGWEMTWWLTTVCVGGFLGGFATLVVRMNPGDEDDDDPGRGAVV